MIVIPLAILGLVGVAAGAQAKRAKKRMDPHVIAQRQVVYETAINTVKDPIKLRLLSNVYRQEGLIAEADMLAKRAALQELPEDVKASRKEAFRKGMASTNPAAVMNLASAFEQMGCTGAAANLRKYASGLTVAEETTDEQA